MDFSVCCECGQSLPATDRDASSTLTCPCGRRVVVPAQEELQPRRVFLSAATVERRVQRMIAAGELPPTPACMGCGEERTAEVVPVDLVCERYRARTSGGFRFLVFPWFVVWWNEPRRTEVHGRDTDIRVPLCICPECSRFLRHSQGRVLPAAIAIGVALPVLYYSPLAGISILGIALVFFFVQRHWAFRRRQKAFRDLMHKVPVYRQLLARYPHATAELSS